MHSNNLADLVALQLLGGQSEGTSTELLIGPQSTLTLDTNDILGFEPAKITTGWLFQVGDDGVISCKGNDVYSKKKNTHRLYRLKASYPRGFESGSSPGRNYRLETLTYS